MMQFKNGQWVLFGDIISAEQGIVAEHVLTAARNSGAAPGAEVGMAIVAVKPGVRLTAERIQRIRSGSISMSSQRFEMRRA